MLPLWAISGVGGLAAGAAVLAFTPYIGTNAIIGRKNTEITRLQSDLKLEQAKVKERDEAIKTRDLLFTTRADLEANNQTSDVAFWSTQCKAAFQAGYNARRCNATTPSAGSSKPAAPDPNVVRSLRDLQARGAFRPSTAEPVRGSGPS